MAEEKDKQKQEEKVGTPKIERGEVAPEQMAEIEQGKYHTISQIAGELSYSTAWILDLVKKGRIKGIKPLGSGWRIPDSEYQRVIKEGIPPMPREPAKKPPITEILVEPEVVEEPEKQKEAKKPPSIFPLDFSQLFGGGKK